MKNQIQEVWVYNNNYIPGRKIFLSATIIQEINSQIEILVPLNDKVKTKFKVKKEDVFEKSEMKSLSNIEDISTLEIINKPEIFNYLCLREESYQSYFFCGLDLFFINSFKFVNFNFIEKELALYNLPENQEEIALKWIQDEKTLKPQTASVPLFIASVIKNFLLTFEKQVIFLQGESQSGKTDHLKRIFDFLNYYNRDGLIQESVLQKQNTLKKQSKNTRLNIERSVISAKNQFLTNISFEDSDLFFKTNSQIQERNEIYQKCVEKLSTARKVLDIITECFDKDNFCTSSVVKVFTVFSDDKFKFIGFTVSIDIMLPIFLIPQQNYTLIILYQIIYSLPKQELEHYSLNQSEFLNQIDQDKIPLKQESIEILKSFYSDYEWDFFMRTIASIFHLSNLNNKNQQNKINKISKLLEISPDNLNILFENLKIIYYFQQILFLNLINNVKDKINSMTQKERQQYGEYEALTIIDSYGYDDEQKKQNHTDNGLCSLVKNFFNESLNDYLKNKKFQLEKDLYIQENLQNFYENIPYRNNSVNLKKLVDFFNLLEDNKSFEQTKQMCQQQFDVFMKNSFALLNQDIGKDSSQIIYYIPMQHFFSPIVNYDLNQIIEDNQVNQEDMLQVREILNKSFLFPKIRQLSIFQKKGMLLNQYQNECREFFIKFLNHQAYILRTLKIEASEKDTKLHQFIFNQFQSIDFEENIKRFKVNYPYKLDYQYLVHKFKVMSQAISINPNLVVDYKNIVEGILVNMFGEEHQNKFLVGKTKLFMKANFFEEFDNLLKELEFKKKSRILPFIEKAMIKLLQEHIDNSNKIVRISKIFLQKNVTLNQFQKWKRGVRKLEKYWWKKQYEKQAKKIIEEILESIEYYNVKKIIRIQSWFRGIQCRKIQSSLIQELRVRIFKNKINLQMNEIRKKMDEWKNATYLKNQIKVQFILASIINFIFKLEAQNQVQFQNQKIMKKVMKNFTKKIGIIKLSKKIKVIKNFQKKIKTILLVLRFKSKILKKFRQKLIQKRRAKDLSLQKSIQIRLQKFLQKNTFTLDAKYIYSQKMTKLPSKKFHLNFKYLFFHPNQELSEINFTLFHQTIKLIKSKGDNILNIIYESNNIIFYTKKFKAYIQDIKEQNVFKVILPCKMISLITIGNVLVGIKEDQTLYKINFKNQTYSPQLNQIEKIDYNLKSIHNCNNEIILTTFCSKLCVISQEIEIFQFKREISKISIGKDFFIALDMGGVLYSSGCNNKGQLGIGWNEPQKINLVESLANKKEIIKDITCGRAHVYVYCQSGRFYCWGDNSNNQLGNIDQQFLHKPRQIKKQLIPDHSQAQLGSGQESTYILFDNRNLFAIGRVQLGQICEKFTPINIMEELSNNEWPVKLGSLWTDDFDFIYVKFLTNQSTVFEEDKQKFQYLCKKVFKEFQEEGSSLLTYNDYLAQFLPLTSLYTKIIQQNFKTDFEKKLVDAHYYNKQLNQL